MLLNVFYLPDIELFHYHRPRKGETVPHPDVVRAKLLHRRIAEWGGANNAEESDVVDQFFDDGGEDDEVDNEGDGEAKEGYFNPGPPQIPIFVRQASSTSDNLPSSAARILQPAPILPPFSTNLAAAPPPLSSSTFEVSRRGSRSQVQQ